MTTKRIENGLMATKNSAFIAFYTKPYHHYQQVEECRSWGDKAWYAKIPLLGIINRWDASLGFVGGEVDPEETLLQAAVRECYEEIGHVVNDDQLTLVCSHSTKRENGQSQNTHFFVCEVTPEEIYELQKKSTSSLHSRVESAGYNIVHMSDEAYQNLISNKWAGTGKEELAILYGSDFFEKGTFEIN